MLDTHALVWSLLRPRLLSTTARESLEAASAWGASSAVLYEMRYKHRIGKWPEIAATCITRELPLVSKDATLDAVPGGMRRVW